MATDKYLISKTDILTYRPTATLDDGRIKPLILEAQRMDLKPVLNDALYYDFITKFDSSTGPDPMYANYQLLLNGTTYTHSSLTIDFDGVKPMLAYFALARYVANNPVQITRMGNVIKSVDQSDPADSRQVKALVDELKSVAMSYQSGVIRYLETMYATFTLYNTGGASENASRKTSLNFFKL